MIAAKAPHIYRPDLQVPCGRDDSMICFVGSPMQFPDTVLRTVQSEIGPAVTHREPSLKGLETLDTTETPICAVIVDEQHADELVAARTDRRSILSRASTLIAYQHHDFAEDLMQRHSGDICANTISLLPMNLNLETWLSILRMTLAGGHYIPPDLLNRTMVSHRPVHGAAPEAPAPTTRQDAEPAAAMAHGLTRRENEVLQMLAQGQPNKTIATRLELSEHTVKLHIHRIISKLGVSNRTEAAVWYHRQLSA